LPRTNTGKHGKKQKHRHGKNTHTNNSEPEASATVAHSIGAGLKGSNGVVAVGLPHRNYSVLKQADLNKRLVKVRIRMDPRFSARVTKAAAD
jgi:hypothetical protein